jgi:hypothetical protein
MLKNIISLALLIGSVTLNFKHGWDTFHYKSNPASVKMMEELGINEAFIPWLGGLTVLTGILLLIPKTFFWGNVLSAVSIVMIMALAINAGNIKMALMEIPFFVIPLIMIWLKYPFHN